jgi:hypothetical protein
MISVLVRVEHGPEALAVTLSALVPAVADGLLADAVILAGRPDPDLERVADAVGATLVVDPERSWVRGAGCAKRDWILCLADGDVPGEGWIRALDRFIAVSPPDGRHGRLRRAAGWRQRARSLLRPRGVEAGDLVHRRFLDGAARPARIAAAIERDPVFG